MVKILLVEDCDPLREIYSKNLRHRGFDVEAVANGKDALAQAVTFKPDAVILDIGLPDISGVGVLKILKSDPLLKRIPVVMLTGASYGNNLRECLESGARGYIMKDAYDSVKEIMNKVNLLLGLT